MDIHVVIKLKSTRWKTLLRSYRNTVIETCAVALEETRLARMPYRMEMTVVLANDEFLRELNHEFRGVDAPTNVLAFPGDNLPLAQKGGVNYFLGDIILAHETIRREASEQKKTFKDHFRHLLVHGTLHLLSFDHKDEKEAALMEGKEIKILKKLKVSNPYA